MISAPDARYASRQDLLDHVDRLKKSFIRTQNTNRKGITFCVIDPDLFSRWSVFSEKQRQEALTGGSGAGNSCVVTSWASQVSLEQRRKEFVASCGAASR